MKPSPSGPLPPVPPGLMTKPSPSSSASTRRPLSPRSSSNSPATRLPSTPSRTSASARRNRPNYSARRDKTDHSPLRPVGQVSTCRQDLDLTSPPGRACPTPVCPSTPHNPFAFTIPQSKSLPEDSPANPPNSPNVPVEDCRNTNNDAARSRGGTRI